MLRRISPVYSNFRSDILSQFSPLFKSVLLAVFVGAMFIGACTVTAQQQRPQPVTEQNHDKSARHDSDSGAEAVLSERQLQIAQQSAGLLQMAKDLKAEVDTTNSDMLSVAAFRKADAIERLTQSVKDQNKHPNRKP